MKLKEVALALGLLAFVSALCIRGMERIGEKLEGKT